MREGMLWFDNSEQRALAAKIDRAAEYYTTKYGARPTLCFVNPGMLAEETAAVEGIEIRMTNSVLFNHFWLGMSDHIPAAQIKRVDKAPKPGLPAARPQPNGTNATRTLAPADAPDPAMGPGLAALITAEQATAPVPLLAAPSMPLLPARCPNSPLFEHVDVPQRWYPTEEAYSFVIRAGWAARRRDQRMENLFIRFQREATKLRQPPTDTILPSNGQVVRAHWFVFPDGTVSPTLTQPNKPKVLPQLLVEHPLEAPAPERTPEPAMTADIASSDDVDEIASNGDAAPAPELREVHEFYSAQTLRHVGRAVHDFEEKHGVRPELILVPEKLKGDLVGRTNWMTIPMQPSSDVYKGKVRLVGKVPVARQATRPTLNVLPNDPEAAIKHILADVAAKKRVPRSGKKSNDRWELRRDEDFSYAPLEHIP